MLAWPLTPSPDHCLASDAPPPDDCLAHLPIWQAELVGRELWVSENLATYEEEVAAEEKKGKGAKTGKEKREQRLRKKMKNNPSTPVIED